MSLRAIAVAEHVVLPRARVFVDRVTYKDTKMAGTGYRDNIMVR